MVFFGIRSSRIKDGQINNVTCPNCENLTSMTYSIFGKFAHIYLIPTFPTGKVNIFECNSCKRTYNLKELPESIKQKFTREKQDAKTPIWHFSGLGIIALLITIGSYFSIQTKKNEAIYIKEPKLGDVYSVKSSSSGLYTAMKISRIHSDSVYVIFSDYEVDKIGGIKQIDKAEFYTSEAVGYSRRELIALYDDGTIYNIDRD